MYRLQICQLVVVSVDAHTEEQPRVSAIDYLVVPELDEVALVLLVARGDEPVDFTLEFYLLLVLLQGAVYERGLKGEGEECAGWRSVHTSYGAYHFASRVFPLCGVCRQFGRLQMAGRETVRNALSVLDQDEGEDHCCYVHDDCGSLLRILVYVCVPRWDGKLVGSFGNSTLKVRSCIDI